MNSSYTDGYNGNGTENGALSPQPNPYNNGGVPQYPYLLYPPYQQPGPDGEPPKPISFYDTHQPQYYMSSNKTSGTRLIVRGEEVGIVLVVLLIWVGSIMLFIKGWGKIRTLEPSRSKFAVARRPSCSTADVSVISNISRTFSKYNLNTEVLTANGSPHFVKCNYHSIPSDDPAPGLSGLTSATVFTIPEISFPGGGSTRMLNSHRNSIMMMNHQQHHQPRQNSVFVTNPSSQVSFYGSGSALKNSFRKTKSAIDLPTLILSEEFMNYVRRNSKNAVVRSPQPQLADILREDILTHLKQKAEGHT